MDFRLWSRVQTTPEQSKLVAECIIKVLKVRFLLES